MIHPVECKARDNVVKEYYTIASGQQAKGDDRLYYIGTFSVATAGNQINTSATPIPNTIGGMG